MSKTKSQLKNWQTVRLDEIADFQYGYTASAEEKDTGTKFLRITDIVPDLIDWETVPFCNVEEEKVDQYKIHKRDILIARTGATAGYAKLIRKEPEQSVFASYLIRLKIKDENIDPEFVGRIIESETFKQFVSAHVGGAAQPHANAPVLKNFEISIPDLSTQKQIADILSIYDDLIENNTKRIKILEEMARAIFKEWFVYFRFPGYEQVKIIDSKTEFGKIPEGWEVKKLDERFKVVLGGTPSRANSDYWNGNVSWINSSETNNLRVVSPSEFITKKGLNNSAAKLMPKRTTVLAITGATLGQVSLLEIECSANQSVVGIYDKDAVYNEYLYLFISSQIDDIISKSGGSAQQHINKKIVEEYEILLPLPKDIEEFNKIIRPLFDLLSDLLFANKNLRQARDLLLPKLISGEIQT